LYYGVGFVIPGVWCGAAGWLFAAAEWVVHCVIIYDALIVDGG
jgi:hypothetical protein